MSLYDKINNLYNNGGNLPENRPDWVDEILDELKSIKASLEANNVHIRKVDKTFMDFVNDFRKKMRADTTKKIYPEIIHNGKLLGVTFKGYLYDKSTLKILSTNEAFEIYRELYSAQNK
jgi:hypothetical protein